ncbi:unnamed protein product, partial [Sphacelaria rigidula]
ESYVDADCGREDTTRRSVSSAAVLCGRSPVAWPFKAQKCLTF